MVDVGWWGWGSWYVLCSEQGGKALKIVEHSGWYGRCGMVGSGGGGPWHVVSREGKH